MQQLNCIFKSNFLSTLYLHRLNRMLLYASCLCAWAPVWLVASILQLRYKSHIIVREYKILICDVKEKSVKCESNWKRPTEPLSTFLSTTFCHYDFAVKQSSSVSYRAVLFSTHPGLVLRSFVLESFLLLSGPKSHQRPSCPRSLCISMWEALSLNPLQSFCSVSSQSLLWLFPSYFFLTLSAIKSCSRSPQLLKRLILHSKRTHVQQVLDQPWNCF